MSFIERNEAWHGETREFRQLNSRSGVPRVWRIRVEGNLIITTWGQLDGAMQTATEVMQGVNLGKKNEKSPQQYALERAKEACRKKHWEGYREFHNDQPIYQSEENKIDFENLPLNLSFYKPDNSMGATISKKAEAGRVLYTRKRNGLAFILARGIGTPKLYSRRMLRQHDDEVGTDLTWDDRFPHLIEEASYIMPPNSILLGELLLDDDLSAIQSYTKSLTEQSLLDQSINGWACFYIWDVAFWDGKDMLLESPVRDRHEIIEGLDYSKADHLIPIEIINDLGANKITREQALQVCIDAGWEGFVVVDPDGVYGERGYNFKGKPDRPGSYCAKLKPEFEDDFVVSWDPEFGIGERSTKARNGQGIRSVAMFQYNEKGELVYISNVSSGLTDEMKRTLADTKLFPRVWKIKYTDRRYKSLGAETNALDFARFVEERTDKLPEECINPRL